MHFIIFLSSTKKPYYVRILQGSKCRILQMEIFVYSYSLFLQLKCYCKLCRGVNHGIQTRCCLIQCYTILYNVTHSYTMFYNLVQCYTILILYNVVGVFFFKYIHKLGLISSLICTLEKQFINGVFFV